MFMYRAKGNLSHFLCSQSPGNRYTSLCLCLSAVTLIYILALWRYRLADSYAPYTHDSNARVDTPPELDHIRELLREYAEFHQESLSLVNKPRPRWIVIPTEPAAGMCNRVMNILSALILAIATRRTLLFDWDSIEPKRWYAEQTEEIGHASYSSTFGSSPLSFSYRGVLKHWGMTDEDVKRGSAELDWRHRDFLVSARTADMDMVYPQSALFIQRFDWWGPLVLANRHYSHTVFRGATGEQLFPILFQYLFPLRSDDASALSDSAGKCGWFIQTRRNWERKTADLAAFVSCATSHGMKPASDGLTHYLVSDTSESPGNTGLVPIEGGYCRNGSPECDRQTVRAIYKLSRCTQGAVLTATSTFGACIAGLGRVPTVLRVTDSGACQRLPSSDPALDVGVLASQEPEIANVMLTDDAFRPANINAAFLYLMYEVSLDAVNELKRSLAQLHQHFNSLHHYPLVLFVDDTRKWEWLQSETSVRVHFVEIDPREWAIPDTTIRSGDYPELFRLRSSPDHKGFGLAYRQMSRYSAGYLLNHPYLARFDYVIKIDGDTHTTSGWGNDPFFEAASSSKRFGFWMSYSDTPDVTDNLGETFQEYLQRYTLQLKQPRLIFDEFGNYRRTTFYGCFLLADPAFFRRPEYRQLFEFFDARHGWFRHRWDEQKIYAFYVALYLDETEVEYMDYVNIEHQQWATHASRM